MRKMEKTNSRNMVEQMNKLKLYRTKVKFFIQEVNKSQDETWRSNLPALNSTFDQAEALLICPPQ